MEYDRFYTLLAQPMTTESKKNPKIITVVPKGHRLSEHDRVQLRIKLKEDGLRFVDLIEMVTIGYINSEPDLLRFVRITYPTKNKDKQNYIKKRFNTSLKQSELATQQMRDFGLDENDLQDVYDIIESDLSFNEDLED